MNRYCVRTGSGPRRRVLSLAQSPGGTLPQAMPQWGELKAAYRFFSQPMNSYEQILRSHWERTQAACLEPGEYLLIEDTTHLDYTTHYAAEDLGINGKGGRGLCLHSTLAMKVLTWNLEQQPEAVVVGLMSQQCWARRHPPAGRGQIGAPEAQQPQFQKMGRGVQDFGGAVGGQHLDLCGRPGVGLL